MKRKILSILLAFVMTLTLLPTSLMAAEPTYSDTKGHWAESSIERWSAYGIIQGSNGEFDPNGQLTCAQLATILAKLLKLPAAKDAGFTDNTADAWYYDAINRCAAAGILNGNGDGTVTPDAPISRERAIVMLGRALGIEPISKPDLTKYTDAAKVAPYAQGMVVAMIEAGIVGGVTADELAPQANINRASTVTILDRAISTYADEAGATVKADGGLTLVVADDVTVTGDVDKLLVPADNVEVTVSGSKNIEDITVTGDNSKVILNNSAADNVTLDGKNAELETKSGSKVENVSVTEDAKGATVNAGSGTTVKNVENNAADTTVTGSGTVKNVASDTDITVETKNTNVENSGDEKITVTDAKGKDSTVSATGSGSSTVVNKETASSGGGYSHSHSYDTSKWVFDDATHWHASTCGHNLKIDEAAHTFGDDNICTVCGQVKVDVAVAKIGSKNYKTLPEAVAAAVNGDTVMLVKDCDISTSGLVISASNSITLDLGGKVIKATNTEIGNILVYGTLTLADSSDEAKDGSGTGKIYTDTVYTSEATGKCVINAQAGGTFIMESGLIDTASAIENNKDNGQFAVGVWNDTAEAKVVINGGKIKAGWYCVAGNGQSATYDGEIIINGGILESVADYAVYLPHKGTTTVNGGVIYGEAGGVAVRCGMLKVNGGTITSKGTGSTGTWGDGTGGLETAAINVEAKYGISTVEITGGTFIAEQNALLIKNNSYESSISITGGTFSSDPTAYVAEGYKATKDESANTWTVKKMDGYVKIEGLSGWYETLTDAAKAWRESNQVVTSGNTFGMNSLGSVESITWTVSGVVATGDGEGVIGNNGAGQSILGGGYYTPPVTVNSITIKGVNGAKITKTGDSYLVSAAGKNVVYENITFVDTVRIDSNPANLTFRNCTFEAGFRMPHSADNGKVTIENCTFTGNESSGYAIFAQGNMASFKITDSTISNCQRGINVQAGNSAEVTISGNTIKNLTGKTENEFTYGSAIQLTSAKTFSVTGNTIGTSEANIPVNAFHIYKGCAADSITITGNTVYAKYLCLNEATEAGVTYDMSKVTFSDNTCTIEVPNKCCTKTEVIDSAFTLPQ